MLLNSYWQLREQPISEALQALSDEEIPRRDICVATATLRGGWLSCPFLPPMLQLSYLLLPYRNLWPATGRTLQSQEVDSNQHPLERIVSFAFLASFRLNWAIILNPFLLADKHGLQIETCLKVRMSCNKCEVVHIIPSTVELPPFLIENCLEKFLALRQ